MYPQRACPHPYGSFVANGCDIFLVFQTAGLAEKIRRPRSGIYSEIPLIEGDRLGIEKHVDARPERCKGRIGVPAGIVQRGLCGALCL